MSRVAGNRKGKIEKLYCNILRKTDARELGTISWNFPYYTRIPNINHSITQNPSRYWARFSLPTLKFGDYEGGEENNYQVRLLGIQTPYQRHIFETKILKKNRKVISHTLVELSREQVIYHLEAATKIESLARDLEKENPWFQIQVLDWNQESIDLLAGWKDFIMDRSPVQWKIEASILGKIQKTLNPEEDLALENIPTHVEVEPNNTSQNTNIFQENTLLLGLISSRADEDIYQISGKENETTLVINWTRFGKTALSPQLKLYDEQFQHLGTYKIRGSQTSLRIQYEHEDQFSQKIFLRISDEVGFIQGETGGFKSYRYLLKYHWGELTPIGEEPLDNIYPGTFQSF